MDREKESNDYEWNTDDELEMEFMYNAGQEQDVICLSHEGSPSSCDSSSSDSIMDQFIAMGFPVKLVAAALNQHGEANADAILETLLTYSVLEGSSLDKHLVVDSPKSCELGENNLYDLSDVGSSYKSEENGNLMSEEDRNLLLLVEMGYEVDVVRTAIKRCGPDASVDELTDYICAAEMANDAEVRELQPAPRLNSHSLIENKRKLLCDNKKDWHCAGGKKPRKEEMSNKRLQPEFQRKENLTWLHEDKKIRLPCPMVGFGVPGGDWCVMKRKIPEAALGPPFFYFENVALTPKGVWEQISWFLYEIEPEFVDSLHFSAAARKRGYIHNLPLEGRFRLLPVPPQTIHEAIPSTKKWWPSWDKREKFNCLLTCVGSAQLTDRLKVLLEKSDGEPTLEVQKHIVQQCKKWNLVWVGLNNAAPLEPNEMEMLLGYPENHTRGVCRADRYKALGNSFQIDTVAYHLSVLKDMYPDGINVLSLFTGIGGAEVSLHRLGIPLKNVVSVEISKINRGIFKGWWEQTGQQGRLIEIEDIREVYPSMVESWINMFDGFDLIIGGSPCNNLSGGNRTTRDGLEGEHSSLFYDYYRILHLVRDLMRMRRR